MRKMVVWRIVIARTVAAYLLYKRGAPIKDIAKKAVTNPVEALVPELRGAQ